MFEKCLLRKYKTYRDLRLFKMMQIARNINFLLLKYIYFQSEGRYTTLGICLDIKSEQYIVGKKIN